MRTLRNNVIDVHTALLILRRPPLHPQEGRPVYKYNAIWLKTITNTVNGSEKSSVLLDKTYFAIKTFLFLVNSPTVHFL